MSELSPASYSQADWTEVAGRAVRKRSNDPGQKRKFNGAPLSDSSNWAGNWREDGTERGTFLSDLSLYSPTHSFYADDLRSAMHQASSAVKALLLLSRQPHGHSSSSIPSPSTSPSTSTLPNPATAPESEISRARIETMNKLIVILQRNLRVRYELDVAEVVHA